MKIEDIYCETCGKKFRDYGSNHRKFCCRKCYDKYQSEYPHSLFIKGYIMSEEIKEKIRIALSGLKHPNKKKPPPFSAEHRRKMRGRTGERAGNWQGGITILNTAIRNSYNNRQWRSDIFTRDDFICQECGQRGGKLEAHHIKKFSIIVKECNIKTLEDSLNCERLWDINNGITLCRTCHNKTKDGK